MSGVAFLRLRLQSCSKITESYSNPAPVYVKNQNSNTCFHSCYSKNFLQTLQSQCYPNFRPMLNFMQVRLLLFRDCARTDASQRA